MAMAEADMAKAIAEQPGLLLRDNRPTAVSDCPGKDLAWAVGSLIR